MPPSRGFTAPGLLLAGLRQPKWSTRGFLAKARTLINAASINHFSSTTTASSLPGPSSLLAKPRPKTNPLRSARVFLPSVLQGLRFNSSTSATSTSPVETEGAFERLNLEGYADIKPDNISSISEHIGYLHELGLDFGWGFRSMIQWTLEHVHIYAGTPWWATIVITTILVRIITIPSALRQTNYAAKAKALTPLTRPIMTKMREARITGDTAAQQEAMMELRQVYKDTGTNPLSNLLPTFVPMVLGISSFNLLRHMTELPVPGLLNGGFLWLQDLTQSDPFWILPAMSAGIFFLLIKRGGESGVGQTDNPMGINMMKVFTYVIPAILFLVGGFLPGAIQITLVTATIYGSFQSFAFRNPRIRELLGLLPIVNPQPDAAATNGQAPRIEIAQNDIKRGAESIISPMKNYEAPKERNKSMLEGATSEVKGTVSEMKRTVWRLSGGRYGTPGEEELKNKAKEGSKKVRSKAFLKEAERYEKARKEELQDQRWERSRR
ncbi:MAG: Mitochondrial inner membrane protein oxa1 [Bogoriella megaspora]|nr:MAG: Mitochondrial inner membrane protein oxa1 [Bogoriella megaspora]